MGIIAFCIDLQRLSVFKMYDCTLEQKDGAVVIKVKGNEAGISKRPYFRYDAVYIVSGIIDMRGKGGKHDESSVYQQR